MSFITIFGFILILVFGIFFLLYSSKNKGSKGKDKKNKEEEMTEEIRNSHKVAEKNRKDIPQKDMFDFMEFEKISDSMIVQNKGKRYTMVIQCKGINYDLMSEIEQMAVEEGFITFLNTLKYPIQLYVQARAVDLKENLNIYKKSVGNAEMKLNEINDKYRNLLNNIDADYSDISRLKNELDKQAHIVDYARDITRYVERISLNKSILQRKFYIVLSYNKDEIASTTDFSEQELYNICYRELYTRAQSLISALMGCSVSGKVLDSNELAELLYISYNRDDEKLLDVRAALESGFYRLYSTSKDVFDKREEAMQREVEEEAKRRVQDAIKEVLRGQEEKTPDELIEEYEERVDREAINIIDQSDTPKEAKKVLKDTIVENHVIGVETRKVDRKLRNKAANKKSADDNTVKNIEEKNDDETIKEEEKILKPSANIEEDKIPENIHGEENANKEVNTNKEESLNIENDINIEDDLVKSFENVNTEFKEKEENNVEINTDNNQNEEKVFDEKVQEKPIDTFFDDRLGSDNSEDDSII